MPPELPPEALPLPVFAAELPVALLREALADAGPALLFSRRLLPWAFGGLPFDRFPPEAPPEAPPEVPPEVVHG